MSYEGRITAGTAAIGVILFTAGFSYWSNGLNSFTAASSGAAIAALAGLPLAWLFGRKFDRLKAESFTDSVTGIYNRRFIGSGFPKLGRQAQRRNKRMSVLLLDVNDFKEVNDRFGHAQGDAALRMIAETLKACSIKGEIVGRWGGDEFIMICPYADDKGIEKLAAHIHDQLLKLSLHAGMRLSVSLGSSVFPEDGTQLIQLVQSADKRMYADKLVTKRRPVEPEVKQA
ncbi:GGDEF domain-containing protein [Paenibacillus solisilvae]|uniref:GGDEF domain-containing protein n=1 Tax=Paenibacillus solisilvae TaxID=2486751 RepID=A0ABW0W3R8_9BACL